MEDIGMPEIHSRLRSLVTPDGAIILDAKENRVITLNTAGGYIWRRLQDGKSVESIVCDLIRETGADTATVERDVHEFIEDLTRKQLVTPASARKSY
jgi:Coenzyme PQQ synthesis protein D (PqqD)